MDFHEENLDSQISARDADEYSTLYSVLSNTVRSFFHEEETPMTVRCIHCGFQGVGNAITSQTQTVNTDVLLCPRCHKPLP